MRATLVRKLACGAAPILLAAGVLLALGVAVPAGAGAQQAGGDPGPGDPGPGDPGPGDPERGREVFAQACQPCHDAEPGSHQVGPSLYGVVGREIGTAAGYRRYSQALKQAEGAWTDARLARYLSDPLAMFPEQRKRYDGLSDARDRVDLIAYLRHLANR